MWGSFKGRKVKCATCGIESELVSEAIGVCVECVRRGEIQRAMEYHEKSRERCGLPSAAPHSGGVRCNLCMHQCSMRGGEMSFCGLREAVNGKMVSASTSERALVHTYYDPIPTNCCAAWFCNASHGKYNLAAFFYGCSFDCFFCQNESHRDVYGAPSQTIDEFVSTAADPRVECICYFGGDPEPQFPFAIRASRKILEIRKVRVCWEWNGSGNPAIVRRAAELSAESGGTVKFDLKAWDENVNLALCGVSNKRTYENFKMIGEEFKEYKNLLTATTLLVPGYVDAREVENIAKFISSIDPEIPYSLLVFHPDHLMRDMPITPREQVEECYEAARRYLRRVHIGNKHLLLWQH